MGDVPDDAIFALADMLKDNNACLSVLKLQQCGISTHGVVALARALGKNNTLTSLFLSIPWSSPHPTTVPCHGEIGVEFAIALRDNTTLTKLYLTYIDGCTPLTAVAFSKTLRVNKTLTELDLSWNFFEGEGVQELANALRDNTSLMVLKLHCDAIKDAGAIELASALRKNKNLKPLGLAGNHISDIGAAALSDMLRVNETLTTLDLAGNKISDLHYNNETLIEQIKGACLRNERRKKGSRL